MCTQEGKDSKINNRGYLHTREYTQDLKCGISDHFCEICRVCLLHWTRFYSKLKMLKLSSNRENTKNILNYITVLLFMGVEEGKNRENAKRLIWRIFVSKRKCWMKPPRQSPLKLNCIHGFFSREEMAIFMVTTTTDSFITQCQWNEARATKSDHILVLISAFLCCSGNGFSDPKF